MPDIGFNRVVTFTEQTSLTLEELAAQMERLGPLILEELEPSSQEFVEKVTARVSDYLDEHGINVDSDLKKSIAGEVIRTTDAILADNFTTISYGGYRHFGTDPHWMPVAPSEDWVRKKLGITEEKEMKRVAFLVRRKISIEGTTGDLFLFEPFDEVVGEFLTLLPDLFADAVANSIAAGVTGAEVVN